MDIGSSRVSGVEAPMIRIVQKQNNMDNQMETRFMLCFEGFSSIGRS